MKENAFQSLCHSGETCGPVAEEVIQCAQRELDVNFPNEYREFLSEFGALLGSGLEIYGLPSAEKNDPPLWQDIVSVTHELRARGQAGTEKKSFIPISEDGTGVYFFLDTTACPETKIWAIGPGIHKLVSRDFCEFAVNLSEGKY